MKTFKINKSVLLTVCAALLTLTAHRAEAGGIASATYTDPGTRTKVSLSKMHSGAWVEQSPNGNFYFQELVNNARGVDLYDGQRNMAMQIDLRQNQIRYGQAGTDGRMASTFGAYILTGFTRSAPQAPCPVTIPAFTQAFTSPATTGTGFTPVNSTVTPVTNNGSLFGRVQPVNSTATPVTNSGSLFGRVQPVTTVRPDVTTASNGNLSPLERAIFRQTNLERQKHGLPALKVSTVASRLSKQHSKTMANSGRLSHDGMSQRLQSATSSMGVRYAGGAENVINGFSGPAANVLGADLVKRWTDSPGHRRNILSAQAKHIGIGFAIDRSGKVYATQLFLN